MPTQIKDGQPVAAMHTTTQQAREATTAATQQLRDLMIQLVRQGQDTSLKSLQVWADLARQLGSTPLPGAPLLRFPGDATMVSLTYDLFERLLATQREVVDELVTTQRRIAQQFFDTTPTAGSKLAPS
jgi:hypothetical protein